MIKACIFDLDGVIVDTAHYHYLAWKRLADELGYHLSEADNERLKGVSRMQSLNIILALADIDLNENHKQILADKKNLWFNEYLAGMTPAEIFPGVKQLLRELKAGGLKIGLASSSKNAKTVVARLKIQNEFEVIVDGTMISRTKPDPEIFLITAAELQAEPASCIVVEDAEAGVEAALAAGMMCIGVGSPESLKRAHKIFRKTSDIRLSTIHELDVRQ